MWPWNVEWHKIKETDSTNGNETKSSSDWNFSSLRKINISNRGLRGIGQYFGITFFAEFNLSHWKWLTVYKYNKKISKIPSKSEEIFY